MKDSELEVKLYIQNLAAVEGRLQKIGSPLIQPRVLERNLRFDTPAGDLGGAFQVLRLRQDTAARMTFKGPSHLKEGVRVRQEIEFEVSDFDSARAFLEAIGYQVRMTYEKFRTVYRLEDVLVTLDELPYGDFVEVEGPDPAGIRMVTKRLELNWEYRIPESYVMLFDRVKTQMGLDFRDLTFNNFSNLEILPQVLGVQPAD